ncbi:hypothetical protein T4D_1348 [Trichinella pseudospiralis]|uniref:Uncharacterized protein n=1 Tax=Trichinella pseudospiralis TaxID=6337 RepID=A0A0V1FEA2_TRIPS|nr:hypothetical protein T4D_1348 [Trichinella pseudospiralis]
MQPSHAWVHCLPMILKENYTYHTDDKVDIKVGRDEGKLWKHLLLVDGRKGKIDLSFACCLVYFLKKLYSCCRQPFNREALLALYFG